MVRDDGVAGVKVGRRIPPPAGKFEINLSKILPDLSFRGGPESAGPGIQGDTARPRTALALCRGARYISGEFPDKASGGVHPRRRADSGRKQGFRGPKIK
jgi:hypothetical protein